MNSPAANTSADCAASSSVFDMNTKAVVSLKAGRIQEGMEGLRTTLVHARTLLLSYQETQQQRERQEHEQRPLLSASTSGAKALADSIASMMDLEEGEEEPRLEQALPLLSLFSVPLFAHNHQSQQQQELDNHQAAPGDADAGHCPLFDRAFVLASDNPTSDKTWMEDVPCQNVTLGVLLYNLALAHHLLAIYKGDTSRNDYQVAINLYQMALSLLNNAVQRSGDGQQDDDDQDLEQQEGFYSFDEEDCCQNLAVLLCAIFNNMANIHSRHFHVQETRNCLECLKEIVNAYANSSHHRAGSSASSLQYGLEEDHFFFYLNLYVTAPAHDFAIAPAA